MSVQHRSALVQARLAGRVREANYRPDQCSACRTGYAPDTRWVDFELPPLMDSLVGEGQVADMADAERLVLCSSCVEMSARLIGVRRDTREDREIVRLTEASRVALEAYEKAEREHQALLAVIRQRELGMA